MKKIRAVATRTGTVVTPVGLIAIATLAVAFWFSSSPAGLAQTNCTVCHKRTQTLTFNCTSLEYRRHLDHGDPMGACAVTPTENP